MGVVETIQVACTDALTAIVAVAVDAALAVGARPSARTPRMAAGNADFIVFLRFITMTPVGVEVED
jgi:hypothetical protein